VAEVLPEARAVYLFGSCATPATGPGSDVNLPVLADEPIAPERLPDFEAFTRHVRKRLSGAPTGK